jgi:hypothetical protein
VAVDDILTGLVHQVLRESAAPDRDAREAIYQEYDRAAARVRFGNAMSNARQECAAAGLQPADYSPLLSRVEGLFNRLIGTPGSPGQPAPTEPYRDLITALVALRDHVRGVRGAAPLPLVPAPRTQRPGEPAATSDPSSTLPGGGVDPVGARPAGDTGAARPDADSPLDRLIARRKAEQERDTAARVIGGERERVWQSCLVGPVTDFAPRWAEAWERFGAELRAGHLAEAAATFTRIDGLLGDLQRLWSSWVEARDTWFREQAEPWNRKYHETGGIAPLGPSHEPAWLFFWVRDACTPVVVRERETPGPGAIPARVAAWVDSQISEHRYGDPVLEVLLESVFLFGRLGGGAGSQSGVERDLSELAHRGQVAAVALILAAAVLPAPDLLTRFLDRTPDEGVRNLADRIFGVSAGVIGDAPRHEFGRLRGERGRGPGDPAPVVAAPARPGLVPPTSEPAPDTLQQIRDDLERRESEAAGRAERAARRRQLDERLAERFRSLISFAGGLLAPEQRPRGATFFADLARSLVAFNQVLREADREYLRYRVLERLERASRAGVPALDTAASLLLQNPAADVGRLADHLERLQGSRPHDVWVMWLTYILDQLMNSHRPPARDNVPPDTTREEWRKAERAFGCILFPDDAFRVMQEGVDRAASQVEHVLKCTGHPVPSRPPCRVRDLIARFDPRAMHWYCSEPLPLPGLLQPPPAIESVTEPAALRRQLDEVWTAASCLQFALDRWAGWFVELHDQGDAHPAVALDCCEMVFRAITVLLSHRPNVAPFDQADEAALRAMLPPVPAWWMPGTGVTLGPGGEEVETPRVRWQEDREFLDRYYAAPERRCVKAAELRSAAARLIDLLKTFPSSVVAPRRTPAGSGEAAPPDRRIEPSMNTQSATPAARLRATLADLRRLHADLSGRSGSGAPCLPDADTDLGRLWALDSQVEILATQLGIGRPEAGTPAPHIQERGWTRIRYCQTTHGVILIRGLAWEAGMDRLTSLAAALEAEPTTPQLTPTLPRSAEEENRSPAQDAKTPTHGPPPSPTRYLMSWREILDALDLKNNQENQRRVRDLNKQYEGPIALPTQGGQPKVNKAKLLDWWNHLEIRFMTAGGGTNTDATLQARHEYGRDGTVLPDISGHVQKRRGQKNGG